MRLHEILFGFLILTLAFGCSKLKKLTKNEYVEEKVFSTSIPFKYVDRLIIIEAEIDNQLYNFVFDTGADLGVISPDLLSKINHKKQGSIGVKDSNKSKGKPSLLTINSIKFGDVTFKNISAVSQDFSAIQNRFSCDVELHGIIGNNLMRKAIWYIDYKNEEIKFQNIENQFPITKDVFTIPFNCEKIGSIYIPLTIDNKTYKFKHDSGSAGFISTPEEDISSMQKSNYTTESVGYKIGLYGAKEVRTISKKTKNIQLGDIQLKDKIITFKDFGSSLLGNELWENFNIIIDWKNCQLHLDKIREIKKEKLYIYQYDFKIDVRNKEISIGRQWKAHTLYRPIGTKNQVLSINDYALDEITDFCSFIKNDYPSLLRLDSLKISILENGKKESVKLKKELLIPN